MFGKKRREKERRQGRSTFGFLICAAALFLLFWNEGRGVKTARSLSEGQIRIVPVSADAVDPEQDGRLVHLIGKLHTPDAGVRDPELGIRFPDAVKVRRSVEMYQWKGTNKSKGSPPSYTYKTVWENDRIDSADYAEDRKNPPFPFGYKRMTADTVKLGAFILSTGVARHITTSDKILLEGSRLEGLSGPLEARAMPYNGGIYIAAGGPPDPDDPEIGDIRVVYYGAGAMRVSVIAKQQGNRLVPFVGAEGVELAMLEPGSLDAAQMFAAAARQNTFMTWALRFMGLFLMFGGLRLALPDPAKLAGGVPVLDGIARSGRTIAAAVAAVALSLMAIGASWLIHRPLTAALAAAGILLLAVPAYRYRAKQRARDDIGRLKTDIMKLAVEKGGRLTVTEVAVGCGVEPKTAEDALTALVQDGVAGMDVTDSGVMVYTFWEAGNLGKDE
jgi:predicted transcriptional regulator